MRRDVKIPAEPIPKEYEKKNDQEINLNLDSHDIEQLQVLKLKLKNFDFNNKNEACLESLNQVIDYLDGDVTENIQEIVRFVMWKIERLILKKKSGETKKALAVRILKRLFHDDENLTSLFIESQMKNLKQIRTLKRTGLKLWRYFLKSN